MSGKCLGRRSKAVCQPVKAMKAKKPTKAIKAKKPAKAMKAKKPTKAMKAKKPSKTIKGKKLTKATKPAQRASVQQWANFYRGDPVKDPCVYRCL